MVGMLVRNQNAVEVIGCGTAQRFKPPQHLFFAESGIDEESGVLGLEQRGVARTARSQNRNAEWDALGSSTAHVPAAQQLRKG